MKNPAFEQPFKFARTNSHDQRNPQATAWAAWEAKERSTRC